MTNIPPVVSIKTVEDLYKILTLKRIISRRANEELLNIAGDKVLKTNVDPTDEETIQFMLEERELLRKYASYPSLTEWNLMPEFHSGTKWGSTFGVTVLVGELILENIRQLHTGFSISVLQKMLLAILGELNKSTASYLIDAILKITKWNIARSDGKSLNEKDKEKFICQILISILESFVSVMDKYGLVNAKENSLTITDLGRRVLLHMKDAQDFVDVLADVHAKLQNKKSDFSITPE